MAALLFCSLSSLRRKTNAALRHLILHMYDMLYYVQEAVTRRHVRGLSCYNNPNRLTGGQRVSGDGGGGQYSGVEEDNRPITGAREAEEGWA